MFEVHAIVGPYRSKRFSSYAAALMHADDKVAETGQAHAVVELKTAAVISPKNRL
jgi:hypothetical protein